MAGINTRKADKDWMRNILETSTKDDLPLLKLAITTLQGWRKTAKNDPDVAIFSKALFIKLELLKVEAAKENKDPKTVKECNQLLMQLNPVKFTTKAITQQFQRLVGSDEKKQISLSKEKKLKDALASLSDKKVPEGVPVKNPALQIINTANPQEKEQEHEQVKEGPALKVK